MLFGQTIELSTPALVIILLGCGIFVMPTLLPLLINKDESEQHSKEVSRTADVDIPSSGRAVHPANSATKSTGAASDWSNVPYQTIVPGVSGRITRFSFHNAKATVEVAFQNDSNHDTNFCSHPDSWRINDEINSASYGWPLLDSGGTAVCDGPQWKQMKPTDTITAFVIIACPTGENDNWSLYLPELRQMPRGLRFKKTP